MILLRANHELEEVFKRLIQTMKINVIWTGLFAVVDNYLILQGEMRSLFFDFENRTDKSYSSCPSCFCYGGISAFWRG